MSSVWLQVAIAGTWVGGVLLLAAIVNRYLSADSEILRKVVHIGTGNVILLAWWLDIPAWVGISASILASTVALVSYKFPILPNINSIGRQSLGTFFYAVSIGLLIAWFWTIQQPHYAVLGILVMTWGDGLAALIGQRFGKHPYTLWGMKKSWEGTLTMAIVSYIVSSLIFLGVQGNVWQTWVVAIAVALVASSLEAFSKFGIDNLTVPLGSAALGFVLNQLFPLG
ncbi:MAG: SEC59/DGK1/VTE5 family protein [Gloeocapsa sp. UFS-A4-WI-NPMV-4B04]|nr:SEC59/DGK1/VTE5 family protein [Gloeocapsa sp. UFS-A4-WI-NPMV-4B04]